MPKIIFCYLWHWVSCWEVGESLALRQHPDDCVFFGCQKKQNNMWNLDVYRVCIDMIYIYTLYTCGLF